MLPVTLARLRVEVPAGEEEVALDSEANKPGEVVF